MKLHANAALSLINRRRLVGRVVEEGWSIKAGALAGETSERTAAKWGSATEPRASSARSIAARRRRRSRTERPMIASWRSPPCRGSASLDRGWLSYYNFDRRHGSLGHRPPGARLAELNNLVGS